jgi:hypothetical protein
MSMTSSVTEAITPEIVELARADSDDRIPL